jgi:hypothetical protein
MPFLPVRSKTRGSLPTATACWSHAMVISGRPFLDFGEISPSLAEANGLGVVGGSNPWFHVPRDTPDTVAPATLSAVTRATARALEDVERWTSIKRSTS